MAATYTSALTITSGFSVGSAIPIDVRTVVDSVNDLTSVSKPYIGLLVNIKGTSDVYVLTKGGLNAKKLTSWVKIGGVSTDELATKIVSSTDEITSPYTGQVVYIKDDTTSSEDESGLSIYDGTTWVKISGTTSGGSSSTGDTSTVINTSTTDNVSAPTSGTGLSVAKDDTTSIDDYANSTTELKANINYTSQGIRSYDDSSDGEFEGINYISLSNGGTSYLKFYSNATTDANWIEICIKDDTLGITADQITYYNADGVEVSMADIATDDKIQVAKGTTIKFATDVKLSGLNEERYYTDNSKNQFGLVFESTGSTYEDLDIYTTNPVPAVYAYLNNTSVKVLTETDVNSITDAEIDSLFTTTE